MWFGKMIFTNITVLGSLKADRIDIIIRHVPAMETTGNIVSIERSGPAIYNTGVGIQIHFYYDKSYLTGIQQMIV